MKNIEEFISLIAGRSIMARLAASLSGIALLLALSSAPMAQTIDFESFPDGSTPAALDAVNTQFSDSDGVTFGLLTGGDPVLAKVGGADDSEREAFFGPTGPDTLVSDVGQFFLTDTGVVGPCCPNLVVTYDSPVATASGVVLDVDTGEVWTILAFDAEGNLLDQVTFTEGDPNTGDGSLTPWSLGDGSTNAIKSVRLSGSEGDNPVFFGFGWDNFTSTTLDDIFSDVVAEPTFSGDDFLDLSLEVERDTTFRHPFELTSYVSLRAAAEEFGRNFLEVQTYVWGDEGILELGPPGGPGGPPGLDTDLSDWGAPVYPIDTDFEFGGQLEEALNDQDQSDMNDAVESVIPELQGITVLASTGPSRDVIVLARE